MENIQFDIPKNKQHIIKVIGVGGGGGNAVNYMFDRGIAGVDFAVCNTDKQALDVSVIPVKIQLGPELTDGKGAGNKPEVGRQACIESINDVKTFLDRNTRMLFITAGMGGGTGTGAAPIIAKAAKEMGILTVAIVTKPFTFEGNKRRKHGDQGIAELRANVDTLVVVSNDKLRNIYPELSLQGAFSKADDILATAAKGIAEIITKPGYVNVDFEDVNTVMRDSGVAVMGVGIAEGDNRAINAVNKALESPLLENQDIKGAQNILVNISSGKCEVSMDEMFLIMEEIQAAAGEADVIWGTYTDESLENEVSVTVIATGFGRKSDEKKDKIQLDNKQKREEREVIDLEGEDELIFETELDPEFGGRIVEFEVSDRNVLSEFSKKLDTDVVEEPRKIHRKRKKTAVDVDNLVGQTLREFESVPAYKRKQMFLQDEIKSSGEFSNLSVSGDSNDGLRENSYLHKKVD
jgi:cell division protein FtsZ